MFAIPHLLVLGLQLAQTMVVPGGRTTPVAMVGNIVLYAALTLMILGATLVAYLLSQGATILAVSELYLGKSTSIGESLKRVWSDILSLLGVVVLNGLVVGLGFLFLILPGIYLACRLLVCVPSALIENRTPSESLSRSFDLTRGSFWRSFVILALTIGMGWAAQMLFMWPFAVGMATSAHDPSMVRVWGAMAQVGSFTGTVLVGPILLIATSIYYFDLRVRKEAFDIQFMMNPDAVSAGAQQRGSGSLSIYP
jgi:hypothetical protein